MNMSSKRNDLDYIDIVAMTNEANAPPGGLQALLALTNQWPRSIRYGIDMGCNTGIYTLELANIFGGEIIGIDLSSTMIERAKKNLVETRSSGNVDFRIGDAQNIMLADGEVDFVYSGGSTAFVPDRQRALNEYARVVRPGGIVSELNFFYSKTPPQPLIDRLSAALGFEMPIFKKSDWLSLYRNAGLEELYVCESPVEKAREEDSSSFVSELLASTDLTSPSKAALAPKLKETFDVFIENNEYLSVLSTVFMKPLFSRSVRLFG